MVGAGALGFDIVKGFRQSEYIGKGLAAGITIVLLGIMLDRITTYGAQRAAGSAPSSSRRLARLRFAERIAPNRGRV
jgi:glycine betaine/proline transport system permease protein